jgi:DNA polymerase-1
LPVAFLKQTGDDRFLPGSIANSFMQKKLFLLDGMALAYRAHFALIARPIFTSKGVNTSALYGFTQTLLDILKNQQPTHIGVAFDTDAPTARHTEFAEYKAHREAMPEELSAAMPHVFRMVEAFNIPVIKCDGFEADDLIGTLICRAAKQGFISYMVTPDKDFGQLVSQNTFIYKPSRMGDGVEIMGVPEVLKKWNIKRPEQVIDLLGLMGDSSDNIPGVPGIGEKTASKLIAEYDTIENLLANTASLKGKLKETLEKCREEALMSKRLATIDCNATCPIEPDQLVLRKPNDEAVKALCVEFEFNSIGKRLFGNDFKAGRGFAGPAEPRKPAVPVRGGEDAVAVATQEMSLFPEEEMASVAPVASAPAPAVNLKTITEVPHKYELVTTPEARKALIKRLRGLKGFGFDTETTSLEPREARLLGLAFAFAPQEGFYVPMPEAAAEAAAVIEEFRPLFEDETIEKTGHNLKYDCRILKNCGIDVAGKLFDTMLAHSLVEPDMRHGMDYLSEVFLGYTPIPITRLIGEEKTGQINMSQVPVEKVGEYSVEDADVTWQLRFKLEPLLKERGQERVYYDIEGPLLPVLVDLEHEGIRVDAAALADFSLQLSKEMDQQEKTICKLAGTEFNVNSPRQLGQILFDVLKICEKPKKTKTGQYSTDEQTLISLAPDHEIVQRLLDYRTAAKLKSTYADTLPAAICPKSGRVHTTFTQTVTATGRLNSQNPNLQNIPIRTERGQEIRKAFVPRDEDHLLLSADYSQIELRIIAALSREAGLLEAFHTGVDVHTATAAKVFGVALEQVNSEMRRKAKMVNYGIAYGISAFGLAQRLNIPRKEAGDIINQYFAQFSGIRQYMDDTIAFARKNGYVETVTGRRRYIRDIREANASVRGGAERNAINAPIQGSAADMIKLAMVSIHRGLRRLRLRTKMLLQVHDELVFDLYKPEKDTVMPMVEEKMRTAIKLDVPIEVEMGVGKTWLEAH